MTQLWAIQTKLGKEDSTLHLVDAFHKLGLNWAAFPLVPFQHSVPDFEWEQGPIVYYGSTGLVKRIWSDPELAAKARLFFSPGTHAPSFYGRRLGSAWMNYRATWLTVWDVFGMAPSSDRYFVRPDDGLKTFAGTVDTLRNIRDLLDRMRQNGAIKSDDRLLMNQPIDIECEFRTWVIGGEVAACVGYKANGVVRPWYEPEGSVLDREVRKFARTQGAMLPELEAFVLDVAVADGGLCVVEINDIHASGFYLPEHILDVVAELSNYVAKNPSAKGTQP